MLGSGSGPVELIIVVLGWILATIQDPVPPSGPAACEMKCEEELEQGLNISEVTCIAGCIAIYIEQCRIDTHGFGESIDVPDIEMFALCRVTFPLQSGTSAAIIVKMFVGSTNVLMESL